MPWTIPVPLLPDESISSWLTRAALTQGCEPMSLTACIWPRWRVWTIDPDRGIPSERLRALELASGIPASAFESAAIRADAECIAASSLSDYRTWPWVLALGARTRNRRGGQQICPACMEEDVSPYLRRRWRFAWHVSCLKHGNLLIDRCPVCHSPIEPHRLISEDRHLALCARCKTDFRKAKLQSAGASCSAFQGVAERVLHEGQGEYDGRVLAAAEWFATMRHLLEIIRKACRRDKSKLAGALRWLGVPVGPELMPKTLLPLEMLSVAERVDLLAACHTLLKLGAKSTFQALTDAGVSMRELSDRRGRLPYVFGYAFESAPQQDPRRTQTSGKPAEAPHPKSRRAVMASWARLQRKMRAEVGLR